MGGTIWSDRHYKNAAKRRKRDNRSAFGYDEDIRQGRQRAGVHPLMDPKSFTNSAREARDSEENPCSTPIAVMFDVTGSMRQVPGILQKSLCSLMSLCLRKGFVQDPAILISGIGDATCDVAPLQIGQFESGNEIENDLNNLFLEGGGGGQQTESYELALYFLARKANLDCVDKRGKRGYAFIIGDEMPYRAVSRRQVRDVFGDKIRKDIPIDQVLAEAQEKFEVYFVLPNLTSYYNDARIIDCWRELLGQNALRLADPQGISELIASVVGVAEESLQSSDIASYLQREGVAQDVASAVQSAIVGGQ